MIKAEIIWCDTFPFNIKTSTLSHAHIKWPYLKRNKRKFKSTQSKNVVGRNRSLNKNACVWTAGGAAPVLPHFLFSSIFTDYLPNWMWGKLFTQISNTVLLDINGFHAYMFLNFWCLRRNTTGCSHLEPKCTLAKQVFGQSSSDMFSFSFDVLYALLKDLKLNLESPSSAPSSSWIPDPSALNSFIKFQLGYSLAYSCFR